MNNQGLYAATLKELTQRGCPEDLASKAATVVANDDPTKTDLGRTQADQEIIHQTLPYLQQNQ